LSERSQTMRDRALELVREGYGAAIAMRSVDLKVLNASRPPELHYRSHDELFREFWNAASAVARFAVVMGLITPADDEKIVRDYSNALDANDP
jgi:hypothetical protein